jgi:hypothetical protein
MSGEIIGIGSSSNERDFTIEAHETYGLSLKRMLYTLERLDYHVKESHLKNKETLKNVAAAKKAIENIQVNMHRSLMSTDYECDEKELVSIYLGRLPRE